MLKAQEDMQYVLCSQTWHEKYFIQMFSQFA